MKLLGHTPNGDCIVVMSQVDYEGLLSPREPLMSGTELKYLRKKRGDTLKDVSRATGVSVSFLSDIERGKSNPSMDTYKTLAKFYGCR